MWNVFHGDPLTIDFDCLDDNEDPITGLGDYSINVNLVWGDDDDERLEYETSDLTIDTVNANITVTVPADDIETSLPLGKKTRVFCQLTPPSEDAFTTFMGWITVRHA